MGVWDMYCCFCAGPLGGVRTGFVESVKSGFKGKSWPPGDGEWCNPKGFPVPDKPVREIVRITHEDSQYWEETVVVGPMFKPTWVSRPVFPGSYGDLKIDGSSAWQNNAGGPYNVVHINCLSLLCRRLDVTPEQWWLSFYGPESPESTKSGYQKKFPYAEEANRLKFGIDYYDMDGRNGQDFAYAIENYTKKGKVWWDPESYEDCNWIFASPAIFPRVPDLPAPLEETSDPIHSPTRTPNQKVFFTPDLLFTILDFAVPYVPQEVMTRQLLDDEIDNCPTMVHSFNTMLSMLQVNKRIYNWIIQSRQDLFFRIVWQMGFMLPACPLDWKSWNAINDPLPPVTGVPIDAIPGPHNPGRTTTLSNAKDWRAYMMIFMKEVDPHMRSRYRLHRLHVQHARGKEAKKEDGTKWKYWSCGKIGVGTALECPEPYEWEKDDYVPAVDLKSLGDEDLEDPTESDAESDDDDGEEDEEGDGIAEDDDEDDDDDEDEDEET